MSDLKEKLLSLKTELSTRVEKIEADLSHRQTSHKFSEQSVDQQNDGVLYNLKSEAEEELEQIDYKQIRKIFLQPDMPDINKIEFKDTDYSGIVDYLANERSFSQERVQSSLNRLKKGLEKRSHTLDQWFK